MTRARTPIESFGPLLFNTLIEGSKRKVTFTLPYREAIDFRIRIHRLRNRMREDGHQLYSIVAKAKVSITWDRDAIPTKRNSRNVGWPLDRNALVQVTVAPHDSQFDSALRAAGVDTQSSIDTSLISKPDEGGGHNPATSDPNSLENLLKDYKAS